MFTIIRQTNTLTAHSISDSFHFFLRAVQVFLDSQCVFSIYIFNVEYSHRTHRGDTSSCLSYYFMRERYFRSHAICSSTDRRPFGMSLTYPFRSITLQIHTLIYQPLHIITWPGAKLIRMISSWTKPNLPSSTSSCLPTGWNSRLLE